jgi:hypothetical protein
MLARADDKGVEFIEEPRIAGKALLEEGADLIVLVF